MTELLRRRRGLSRWLAGLLVVAWMAPLMAAHADDDALCAPFESGGGRAIWASFSGLDQPHHCVVCHSIRSHSTPLSDCGPARVNLTSEQSVVTFVADFQRAAALDSLPPRAPPA